MELIEQLNIMGMGWGRAIETIRNDREKDCKVNKYTLRDSWGSTKKLGILQPKKGVSLNKNYVKT